MHLILCPACGRFWLYYRKPGWWRDAQCHHYASCATVPALQRTSVADRDLQAVVLEHRGERSARDVLADWLAAVNHRDDLVRRRQRLQLEHPDWHRLKCLRKAREEQTRERRAAQDAANPTRAERRREKHPRWWRQANRARRELRLNGDKIARTPYTQGIRRPAHWMPDELPVKKRKKGPRLTPRQAPKRKPFTPLPPAIRAEREARAVQAATGAPSPKTPTPGIRRRPAA